MATLVPNFGVVNGILATAVANSATFTLGYPTGFVQDNFTYGLASAEASLIVNGNDKYTVSGGKISVSFGASLITVTNLSGATLAAGSTVALQVNAAAGSGTEIFSFPIELASVTGSQDVVTAFRPGVAGVIEDMQFVANKPATTAAKLATFTPFIGAVAVTGGVIALTTALATPMGKVTDGTAVTAANAFLASDTISIKATAVTAFAEGSGTLMLRVRKTQANNY